MIRPQIISACAALLAACTTASSTGPADASSAETELPTIPVTVAAESGEVVFSAEVADSPALRQKGLMFREALGDRAGMIFLFADERARSFWMKNTLIPLDMIFIRADRTILGVVANAVPRTLTSRGVPGPSQFVLEIRGGLAAELGIAAGQTVQFYAPIPDR